ncbi:MAG TPA: universal stress protein [Bacteroidia bacterium]|jgi:nucleotide-binding universal stress UspA family protein|nr:universal stress protein [Bacteroidia bacterium]
MITINANKILIPIDFSETSMRAIKHGAAIARSFNSEVVLLNVQKKGDLMDVILPALKLDDTRVIMSFLENKLEQLAKKIREEDKVTVTTKVLLGSIPSEISNFAEESQVGLIIMGTHGSDSTNDFLLGSNSYRVLTNSSIPVMTVRTEVERSGYSNILLPIDSSEHSRQKVNSAIKIADKFGARLHVLGLLGKHEENYEYKLNVILPQIKKMASKKHILCTLEIDRASNRAEKTLEYGQKVDADLIIIMSDEKSGLESLILGSYAHQLINHAKIPVLSIPPELHPENLQEAVIGGMWQH